MPLLIDGNSAAGQAIQQKQQRVASTINLAATIFTAQIGGMAARGLVPGQEDLAPLSQGALTAAEAFHRVADDYATAQLAPKPAAERRVELEG